jgi:signal transduction histidine kinase
MLDAAAYDELPDGVVVADPSGVVVALNRSAARLLGTSAPDAVGRPIADVLPFRDARDRDWWACTDPYGGLATRTGQPEVELRLPDGGSLLVTARFVRKQPGGPVERLVVGLRGTQARARAERDRAELVATVAHELRSPLTSVKGFTSTLLTKWERFTDAQRRLMLETVEADADRVTRLITELLDVARIDSGRLELHRSLVDLSALVRRHIEGLVAAGEPVDRFRVEVAGPLPETWADADKIDEVVDNLLENALRHGSGRVTVTLAPLPASGRGGTTVRVDDEGPGIPAAQAGRVFERFWRGERHLGTGLGLYIARGLVEAHGGTIEVAAAAGGGASFLVTLPTGRAPG